MAARISHGSPSESVKTICAASTSAPDLCATRAPDAPNAPAAATVSAPPLTAPQHSPNRDTLKQRVLRAGGWSLGGHVLSQAIRLGSNLLMTRLLMPEAFGLMAIVIVMMVGFTLFSDIGISQNIVRSPRGEEPIFLNTAWTLQILRGIFIWVLATAAAAALPVAVGFGWIRAGTVYADPLLPWVISAYSLTLVIAGFTSTKQAVARRHMRARALTHIEITTQIVSLVVTVALAWWTHSIWSLVIGALLSSLIGCLLGHLFLPGFANKLAWDRTALQDLFGFGKWVFLSSIVGFMVVNGDRLILGGAVDAQLLGIYTIAFLLVNVVQTMISLVSGSVVFPALCEVALHRPHDLSATANKFQRYSDMFIMTASGFLMISGSSIVSLLYDDRYRDAGLMLSALAVGTIGLRYQVVEQCYLALGKPQISTITNGCRWIALYFGLPISFHFWGFYGALVAIVLSQFAGWPAAIFFKIRYGLMDVIVELLAVPPLVVGLLLGFSFRLIAPSHQALRSLLL